MTHQIKTQHLEDVIKNHGQDMSGKVVAITGTTSGTGFVYARELAKKGATGIIRAAMDPEAKAGNFYGPIAGWTGYPDLIIPEDLLLDKTNIRINWDGCEKAVGKFEIA